MEQLSYDCRLMNIASGDGSAAALQLRDWLSRSDAYKDPQALILAPQNVITISRAIVAERNHYAAGTAAARAAIEIIRAAHREGELVLPDKEVIWLDLMEGALAELPSREEQFIARMLASADPQKYLPAEYGL